MAHSFRLRLGMLAVLFADRHAMAARSPWTYDPANVAITGGTASLSSATVAGYNVTTQSATSISVSGGTMNISMAQAGVGLITLTGTLVSAEAVLFPAGLVGSWTILNNTSGNYNVTLAVAGQASPLALPQGVTRTISSDGTNLYSPISQAVGLTTPTATATGDVASFGGITGQSLSDSGYAINSSGHALAALDGANSWSGFQTFNGGTNLAAGSVGSMLINGDMDIDQQYEGQSNGVGIDRFYYAYTASNGMALQRITGSGVSGYGHYLRMTAPASAVTIASADQRWLRSSVEGGMVEPLQWGTANAQAATLSFWAEASVAGTYSFSIVNSTPNYSYVGTYTIPTSNTWTAFNFTIPAPPSGSSWSIFAAGYYALALRFDLGSGSNFSTSTPNVWQSGNYGTANGSTGLISHPSATLALTAVHLFAGTNAGAYIPRPYSAELALAKRYYAKTFNEGVAVGQSAGLGGSLCTKAPSAASYPAAYFSLPNGMYAGVGSSPVVTSYNPSAANANWRDVTAGADVTVAIDPAAAKGGTGVEVGTASAVTAAGDNLCIQLTYDSGFR